jgi:antirestriction protein ArdC
MHELGIWLACQDNLDKRVDRYFKQAQTAAASLGLTISSRCKLIAPVKDEAPKVNKFAKFGKKAQAE